jgi:hypothetical protein
VLSKQRYKANLTAPNRYSRIHHDGRLPPSRFLDRCPPLLLCRGNALPSCGTQLPHGFCDLRSGWLLDLLPSQPLRSDIQRWAAALPCFGLGFVVQIGGLRIHPPGA